MWLHTWRKKWVNCAVWQAVVQASKLFFPVVFHTENCPVHSGNTTVSSLYLPTPRWRHLKALNLPKWIKERRPLRSLKCRDHFLFLSIIVTRTRRHTELTKKTDKPDGKTVLRQRTFSSVFFTQLNCTV